MNAILSIKPEFVDEIVAGTKRFEYRKSIFKQPVEKVYIYASSPVGRIVGEFTSGEILQDSPDRIWRRTSRYSGISKSFFDGYFKGRAEGYAIEILNFVHYEEPVNPYIHIIGFHAPQSFCYISESAMKNSSHEK